MNKLVEYRSGPIACWNNHSLIPLPVFFDQLHHIVDNVDKGKAEEGKDDRLRVAFSFFFLNQLLKFFLQFELILFEVMRVD